MLGLSPARREAASKDSTNDEGGILQKQRIWREAADLDLSVSAKGHGWMTRGEYLDRCQRQAPKALVVRLDCVNRALSYVNFATFKHRQKFRTDRIEELDLHIGITLRVAVQEIRDDAFQVLRRGRHLQHAGVPMPEQLRPLTDCAGVAQ
jgi:hypothetical protein